MTLAVVEPGLHSTIQDAGRLAHRHLGVRQAGAADRLAMIAANLLVDNAVAAPVLELTLLGGTFAVRAECLVGLTGADMEASVPEEDRSLSPGASHRLRAGTTLRLGGAVDGARAYIALEGGLRADDVLGSCSTDPVAGFGGLGGRALVAGDLLRPARHPRSLAGGSRERAWPAGQPSSGVVAGDEPRAVSLVPGPHRGAFTDAALEALLGRTWRVSARSDRVGLRLEGEAVAGGERPELVSLPMLPGALQLPSGGLPIVLLPDAPTIGGYPVPGVVARVDQPILGQLRPGDGLRFSWCAASVARDRWLGREADLARAAERLAGAR